MVTPFKRLSCATAALLGALSLSQAQTNPVPAASASPAAPHPAAAQSNSPAKSSELLVVQASAQSASPAASTKTTSATTTSSTTTTTGEPNAEIESGGVGVREFQGDEVGQVLRLLARQAKVNMVVSEAVTGNVTMRLEDVSALQAITIIVKAKSLFLDKIDN